MAVRDRDGELAVWGLAPGDEVRFRKPDQSRWTKGKAVRRERDGSLGLVDARGRSRAIPAELCERRVKTARGFGWRSLVAPESTPSLFD